MAHHSHPSDQDPPTPGPRQQALLTVSREADVALSGQELQKLHKPQCLQGLKGFHGLRVLHGLCSSFQQSKPPAHG